MKTSKEILDIVSRYIDSLPYDRQPLSLYEPIKYVLSAGGKRIRPSFVLMAYDMFRDDVETALPAAAALETYHNYTLLHDDLMDNADVRRGRPTVHKKWDANTAILSGDTMLSLAYLHLAKVEAARLKPALDLFTETALEVSEGQQYDMEFESRNDVAEAEYIEMIRLKTSVLLACALKMGALLAGASEEDMELIYKFGEKVGLAFQLQDDYLDVYGDPAVFGKATGGDITSNKKTPSTGARARPVANSSAGSVPRTSTARRSSVPSPPYTTSSASTASPKRRYVSISTRAVGISTASASVPSASRYCANTPSG